MTTMAEIALFTDDVAGVAAFYRDVIGAAPVSEWPGGALFAVGDANVLVHGRTPAMDDGPPNEDHFAFAVGDVDGACASLIESGLVFLVEPRNYPWGRSAYLRDPDGRLVELSQA